MRPPSNLVPDAIASTRVALREATTIAPEPLRFTFVEGIRGVAALTVVLYHAFGHTLIYQPMSGWRATARDGFGWLLQGRASVTVFIVLSGFVLMLPVAAAGGYQRGGLVSYLGRRARRILPPYYAALLLSLLLIKAIPALQEPISVEWSGSQPALTWSAITSHLLLVHNLSAATALKINSPLWTIATEWQLYFVFPLVLLPLWRKFGSAVTIVTVLALTLGGLWLLGRGDSAAPWFAGLFAMGMAAAARVSSPSPRQDHRIYGLVALSIGALYAVASALLSFAVFPDRGGIGTQYQLYWMFDVLVGSAVACGLVYCAKTGDASVVVRLFSSRPLVWLGVVSYSLYLIHDPLLALMRAGLARHDLQPLPAFAILVVIGVPLVLGASYVFHRCVERPFLSRRAKRRVQTEESSAETNPTLHLTCAR